MIEMALQMCLPLQGWARDDCDLWAISLRQAARDSASYGRAGLKAFFTTPQLSVKDKVANSLALGTSPIVRALVDPEGGMRDIRSLDNISFADWFKSHGGSQGSIDRMWDPIGAPLQRFHLRPNSVRYPLGAAAYCALWCNPGRVQSAQPCLLTPSSCPAMSTKQPKRAV